MLCINVCVYPPTPHLFAEAGLVGWYSFLLFQAKYFSSFRTFGVLLEDSEWFDLALLGALLLLLENVFFFKLSLGTTLLVCFLFIFVPWVILYFPQQITIDQRPGLIELPE